VRSQGETSARDIVLDDLLGVGFGEVAEVGSSLHTRS
jgi:hypothetical protein